MYARSARPCCEHGTRALLSFPCLLRIVARQDASAPVAGTAAARRRRPRLLAASAQPFLDEGSALARAFPPRHLATVIPLYAGLVLLCLTAFNVGWSLICAHPRFQAAAAANAPAKQE